MKPRVAMLSYACDPAGGGEHWLGWGWAETAARFCDVTLFTPPKSRASTAPAAQKARICVQFVDLPRWLRWTSEHLGTAGLWWRKIAWAKKAASVVRSQIEAFDIVHQTTFHTFRVPFYAASLGKPSVWGPMAGGEMTPPGFDEFLGPSADAERKRVRQNLRWLKWGRVQKSLRDVSCIFASNQTTRDFLPDFTREKTIVVPPNTLRAEDTPRLRDHAGTAGRLKLIYAGNCVDTRSIPLVLRALESLSGVELVVAGGGTALDGWRVEAGRLRIKDRVTFTGRIPREQLVQLYASSDALVFPALRDSGGSALLEAMSIGLPVICLDWAGPGEMVDAGSGIKVAVHSPEQTIRDLSAAFVRLRDHPGIAASLAAAAIERVRSHFTWDAKEKILRTTYQRLTGP